MRSQKKNPRLPHYGHPITTQKKQYPKIFKEPELAEEDQRYRDVPACDCLELNLVFGYKPHYQTKGCTTGQGQPKDEDRPFRMYPTKVNKRGVCHYCGYCPAWPELSFERREKWLKLSLSL